MKRILTTTILVLLTIGTLNTAQAQNRTPQETAAGLTMLFALEHDALYSCPPSSTAYDGCAQLSYATLFSTRALIDRWMRGFSDTQWLSGWVGDGKAVGRPFTLADYPGELFIVGVVDLGDRTVVIFEWADE